MPASSITTVKAVESYCARNLETAAFIVRMATHPARQSSKHTGMALILDVAVLRNFSGFDM